MDFFRSETMNSGMIESMVMVYIFLLMICLRIGPWRKIVGSARKHCIRSSAQALRHLADASVRVGPAVEGVGATDRWETGKVRNTAR